MAVEALVEGRGGGGMAAVTVLDRVLLPSAVAVLVVGFGTLGGTLELVECRNGCKLIAFCRRLLRRELLVTSSNAGFSCSGC